MESHFFLVKVINGAGGEILICKPFDIIGLLSQKECNLL